MIEQRAVNQTFQHLAPVRRGQPCNGLALQQKFHAHGLIKLAFQDDALVHHGHHAVHYLGLCEPCQQQYHRELEA